MRPIVIDNVAFVSVLVFVVLGMLTILWWANSFRCHAKWDQSGMNVEYALFSGCRVQQSDGRWIPAENYRSLQ